MELIIYLDYLKHTRNNFAIYVQKQFDCKYVFYTICIASYLCMTMIFNYRLHYSTEGQSEGKQDVERKIYSKAAYILRSSLRKG